MDTLDDPGRPIILTVKIDDTGRATTNYLMEQEEAVKALRTLANQIEAETSESLQAMNDKPEGFTGSGALTSFHVDPRDPDGGSAHPMRTPVEEY